MDGEKQKNLDIPHVTRLAGDGIISQFGQRWYYQSVWPEVVLCVSQFYQISQGWYYCIRIACNI